MFERFWPPPESLVDSVPRPVSWFADSAWIVLYASRLPGGGDEDPVGVGGGAPQAPNISTSQSEWPHGVPRDWPFIRAYRAVPEIARSSIPPSPLDVEYASV